MRPKVFPSCALRVTESVFNHFFFYLHKSINSNLNFFDVLCVARYAYNRFNQILSLYL